MTNRISIVHSRALRSRRAVLTGAHLLTNQKERDQSKRCRRCDVYGDEILRAARQAMGGREWEETFERWGIDAAVVDAWCPLARILEDDSGWRVLAKDPGAVTFVRAAQAE